MNKIKISRKIIPGIMDVDRLKSCIKNNYKNAINQKESGTYYAVLLSENNKPEECVATILFDLGDGVVLSSHYGIDEKGHLYHGALYRFDTYGSTWSCEELVNPWHKGFIDGAFLDQGREERVDIRVGNYWLSEICENAGTTWDEIKPKIREFEDELEREKFIEDKLLGPWKAWLALNDKDELIKEYGKKGEDESDCLAKSI